MKKIMILLSLLCVSSSVFAAADLESLKKVDFETLSTAHIAIYARPEPTTMKEIIEQNDATLLLGTAVYNAHNNRPFILTTHNPLAAEVKAATAAVYEFLNNATPDGRNAQSVAELKRLMAIQRDAENKLLHSLDIKGF